MINASQWQLYKNIINKVQATFNQESVLWKTLTEGFQRYGEDDKDENSYTTVTLKCLISYNIYRSWPISKETPAGLLDQESMMIILNKKYLLDLGYLNVEGMFSFDPANDMFTHRGMEYRASGETFAAQANSDPLFIYIILKRLKVETGDTKY